MSEALIPKTNATIGSAAPPSASAIQTGELFENKFTGRLGIKKEDGLLVDPAKVQLTGDVLGTTTTSVSNLDGGTIAAIVQKIQGNAVKPGAVTSDQVYVWVAGNSRFEPMIPPRATTADNFGTQTGAAPSFSLRAWCVFDGSVTGTNPPIAGGNISSIQRIALGHYAVTFTTDMASADYAANVTISPSAGNQFGTASVFGRTGNIYTAPTASGFQFFTILYDGTASIDPKHITVMVVQ